MNERIELSFNKDTAFTDAKSANILGKIYFTPDTHSIVLEGEEYGGSLISFTAAPYGNNGQLVLVGENPIDANSDLNSLMQSKVEARLVIMNPGQSEYLYIPVSMKFDVSNNTVLCSGTYTITGICKMVYFQVLVGGDIVNTPIHIRDVVNKESKEFTEKLQKSITINDNYIELNNKLYYNSKPINHPDMIIDEPTVLPQYFADNIVYEKIIKQIHIQQNDPMISIDFKDLPEHAVIINSSLFSDLGNYKHTIKKRIDPEINQDPENFIYSNWEICMQDDDLIGFLNYSTDKYLMVQYYLSDDIKDPINKPQHDYSYKAKYDEDDMVNIVDQFLI